MVVIEQDAKVLLGNDLFLEAWDSLWEKCPWATVFQQREFVVTWFRIYTDNKPILITDWNGQSMSGLLTLSFLGNNSISAAGFDQAEYQVWLSTPEANDTFLSLAIREILEYFPGKNLHLKYLPSKTPIYSIRKTLVLKNKYFIKPYVQPLIKQNKIQLEAELKKKNRKEKINRLKRFGNLQFVEIKCKEEFYSIFDEMAMQSDFRKGALFDKMIFQTEPQRKEFLLKMFENGLLHVTILKVDEKIIASNAGFISTDMIHLQGINSHSPFYSKYSPGILHFLMLGIYLDELNIEYFDLTPGGKDGYKSILANATETVNEMWISNRKYIFYKSFGEKLKYWLKENSGIPTFQRNSFSDLNISLKNCLNRFKLRINKGYIFEGSLNLNYLENKKRKKYFLLNKEKSENQNKQDCYFVNNNFIQDLFSFKENQNNTTKMDFLSDCMRRIELGFQLFSVTQKGVLVAVFWCLPASKKQRGLEQSDTLFENKPILTCSFYDTGHKEKISNVIEVFFEKILFESKQVDDSLVFEVSSNQKQLMKILQSKNPNVIKFGNSL